MKPGLKLNKCQWTTISCLALWTGMSQPSAGTAIATMVISLIFFWSLSVCVQNAFATD